MICFLFAIHFKSNFSDLVADSYSVRDARLHLRHVRDLLRSLDPADAYNGVNRSSLSYLTLYTRGDKSTIVSLLLPHFCLSISVSNPSSFSPPYSSFQIVKVWGTGKLLKRSLLTSGLQNTSSLDVKTGHSVHCSLSEMTGR